MKTIDQLDLKGRRVLIRVDFNVPLKAGSVVTDATRLEASVPTVKTAADKGAKVILCSHLGRPKGGPSPELSLKPVAAAFAEILGRPVGFVPECVGPVAEQAVAAMKPGEVVLLENLRFHPEEEANDPDFARELAALCDVYVNDAFGTAHRAHASTEGVTRFVSETAAGFLIRDELKYLGDTLNAPARPFVAILGGAKVSDKIAVIEALLKKVDILVIGGGMANTFNKALGRPVGASKVEDDRLEIARSIAQKAGSKLMLPVDYVVGASFAADAAIQIVARDRIPEGTLAMDIGPESAKSFGMAIASAKTIFWNGPMGVFEWDRFAAGTESIARAVAGAKAVSIVGGGDSVAALGKFGLKDKVSHVSTGGGASLEFIEGRTLPGIAALG
ncbi:MAG: phosphoglycerate kinase [Myxococcales bacterium]|nr:phosphoglycerate kinase [Myxococcales bacterium]